MVDARILIASGLLAGLGASLAAAADIPPARQAELSHMLVQDCGSCHGLKFKGGLGRPLTPEALAGKSPEALATVILDGLPGTAMPPWRALVTPDEAAWMVQALLEGRLPEGRSHAR